MASTKILEGLREWQGKALKEWEKSGCRGIVQVATAGGKTRFALACVATWQLKRNDKCLVIVPTLALQDQWVLAIADDLGIDREQISVWGEDNDLSRQFHVMVVNTARKKSALVAEEADRLFLIADECHRYGSPKNGEALQVETAASLGLSATAERQYDDGLQEILVPCLGEIIYEYSVIEAATDEVVSPFLLFNLRVPLTSQEQEKIDRFSKRIGYAMREEDFEKAKILSMQRAAVSKSAASRIPATLKLVEKHRGKRTIIFHEDIASAERIASLIKELGIPVVLYHSKVAPDYRRGNLRQFRSGITPVIVCCRALDEGVDVPEIEVAIVASSTTSDRQRVQRLGRSLRKSAGKDIATIVTLYATDAEEQHLVNESVALAGITKVHWSELIEKADF